MIIVYTITCIILIKGQIIMTIKLTTWNVNGIRAISKKDEFKDWLKTMMLI